MEKPSSASDSGGAAAPYNTVFIDTSLDTHLAIIVSDSDTVSDLKKKIMYEHPLCFPAVEGIKIHALKVKRRGRFYHLSDSMFVRSAFDGICKSWFLSVDASRLQEQIEEQCSGKLESGNVVACIGIKNNLLADGIGLLSDGPAKRLSDVDDTLLPLARRDWRAKEKPSADLKPDSNNRSDPDLQEKHEVDSNKSKDLIMRIGCDEDNFGNLIGDAQFKLSVDGGPKTKSAAKIKSKPIKKREDQSLEQALKENDASAQGPNKDVSWQDIVVPDNSLVSSDERPGGEVHMTNVLLHMTNVLSNGTAVPGNHVESEKDTSMNDVISVQCHVSMGEASPGPTKKKQKTVNNKNASEENRVLYNSTNDTSGPGITISQSSLMDKQKGMNVAVDHLSSEIPKEGHLLRSNPGTGENKRKRKRKSSKVAIQEVASVPNSAENARVESLGNAVGGHNKDSGREVVAPVVQGAMISEPSSISVKDKHSVPVQEVGENNTVPRSLDVDMSTTDAGNAESTNDPPEAAAASAVKGMRISDDRHTIEAGGNPPVAQQGNDLVDSGVIVEPGKSSKRRKKSKRTRDPVSVAQVTLGTEDLRNIETQGNPPVAVQEGNNLSKDTGVFERGNAMVNDRQKFGSDQTARVEEEKELSRNNDPKAPFSRDETDMNSKVVVTSDLLDKNDNVEPGKSSKKRKKSAKCIPSSGEEIDLNSKVEATSNLLDTNDIGEREKSSKKKKKSKKTQDPVTIPQVTSGTEHKIHSVIGTASTEQHETVRNDHLSDKSGKEKGILLPSGENEESKAKTVNAASTLATDRETDNVIRNVLESLQDLSKNPEKAENKVKKSRKQSSSTKSVPELQKEDENVSFKNPKLATDGTRELEVDASSILTKTNLAKTSSEHQLNASNLKPENNAGVETDVANIHGEVSCESDRTIVNDNFVPSQNQPEAVVSGMVLVNKMTKTTKGPDNEVEDGKDQNKSSMKLFENKGSGEKAQAFNYTTVKPQSSLSKGEGDNLKHRPKKKLSKVSGTGTKAPPPSIKSDKSYSKTKDATSPNTVNSSGTNLRSYKNREPIAASNSSLESFKSFTPQSERVNNRQSPVAVRKRFSNNDNGEVLNSSERKKSLLATSGTIFKDDNDWSSDDEEVDNSDSSTKTPSDNSLSSDYSDGDSSAPRHGTHSPKRKEQRRSNISNSHSNLNLNAILRSSSRYKAAKLTASQSQPLDFESQPDEFVPDSLPNP